MNEVTKNKFAEMLKAANKSAEMPAKVKAAENIVSKIVLPKEIVIAPKMNAKLQNYIDKANTDFKEVELSEMTVDDLIKTAPELPNQPKANLTVVNYSDKAIAVIGETYQVKDILKRIGGRFNYNLTCGAGWIFSKTKVDILRKELNLIFVL